ncbi:hypothetical protein DM860_009186 [Cuscuta australis]|uniref:Uncharacterized protein n=1 Tax=Cuscuta australis TaxID=267555 RepID=A0A328DER0_9ASTE|nr:hypothetical protein DM860_009186 [Cuscuta australis]
MLRTGTYLASLWAGLWNHDELILWKTIPCEMVLLLLLFWIFAHDLGVRFSPPLEERFAARRHYLECACSFISWLKVGLAVCFGLEGRREDGAKSCRMLRSLVLVSVFLSYCLACHGVFICFVL